ncbi:OmpL47-type beta-barrel domain-containing protein [Curtobacterium sp. Leaf261]|uniref:OmpL47-type beta-barrel domain-containing protein n=1 Tax=Curtobacterium sp. Leaf261 TaxID=1736311 RepID=UPI000AC8C5DF|nr:hypothetical protein [Curtobacterium sp. Leaf261]
MTHLDIRRPDTDHRRDRAAWREPFIGSLAAAAAATALVLGGIGAAPAGAAPAFDQADPSTWPNVSVLDPSMSTDAINTTLAAASGETEFSMGRHAVFFKPGTYGSDAGQADPSTATGIVNGTVGFYETVAGLGPSPDGVHINGALHVEPYQAPGTQNPWENQSPGSLDTFWRSLSNVQINPIQQPTAAQNAQNVFTYGQADAHQLRWAVSQAAPLRRVDIQSNPAGGTTPAANLTLFGQYGEQASGGFMSDSAVSGTVVSGSQQQFYTQDSQIGAWQGGVWNMVFSGTQGAPAQSFPDGRAAVGAQPTTTLPTTPTTRDAPFLTLGADGAYSVFVPAARTNASGVQWTATSAGAGTALPLSRFFVAQPSDSIQTVNAALAAGKDLILTPGVYQYGDAIRVTRPDTVVLGLGMAAITPTNGTAALTVGDVSGVQLSGFTVDAGATTSDVLLQVGPTGATSGSATDPTTLTDVFVRVGGPHAGSAGTGIEVNSPNTVLDDIWVWRADHGSGVGWTANTGVNGLVVNGDDVTADGLAVEHWQQNQVVWNGDGGTTIFYQSEIPYDVPSQAAWMDGTENGYASYKVADDVASHHAYGLGVYSNFDNPGIVEENAIDTPRNANVRFTDAMTRFLAQNGGISHIIDGEGLSADTTGGDPTSTAYLSSFPGLDTTAPTLTVTPSTTQPNAAGWYRAVTLTPTASDDFTPAATVEVQVDGGAWTPLTGAFTVPDGQHTVAFRATDAADNVSAVQTWSGRVDSSAPVVQAAVRDQGTPSVSVTLAATDAGSGVAGIEYTFGDPTTAGTTWTAYGSAVTPPSGSRTVSFRATDVAGNVSAVGSIAVSDGAVVPVADPSTPAAAGTVAVRTGSGGNGGSALAFTGSEAALPLGIGSALLAAGLLLMVLRRRRARR